MKQCICRDSTHSIHQRRQLFRWVWQVIICLSFIFKDHLFIHFHLTSRRLFKWIQLIQKEMEVIQIQQYSSIQLISLFSFRLVSTFHFNIFQYNKLWYIKHIICWDSSHSTHQKRHHSNSNDQKFYQLTIQVKDQYSFKFNFSMDFKKIQKCSKSIQQSMRNQFNSISTDWLNSFSTVIKKEMYSTMNWENIQLVQKILHSSGIFSSTDCSTESSMIIQFSIDFKTTIQLTWLFIFSSVFNVSFQNHQYE